KRVSTLFINQLHNKVMKQLLSLSKKESSVFDSNNIIPVTSTARKHFSQNACTNHCHKIAIENENYTFIHSFSRKIKKCGNQARPENRIN
ncbi:hypothetical protein, partial [Lacticaseibacillus zeae]|uniref:hypothetical protein n=1 Tax=Lacticaseibacillus zeae TaxID=57037 RepID=UPI00024923AF